MPRANAASRNLKAAKKLGMDTIREWALWNNR